ncbi:hypothetical protein LOAG_01532 [Loa loa]|uniref:Uncharacterized protein n=1 Tax=Loa loa TaxID=7209 RepID=A0A1I7VQ68_LOALO|nr:hypothetical protein LOAG_01532 [Loa loa]EFO26943.2 hypothetical protein LOAG_01532 [Loa loa]
MAPKCHSGKRQASPATPRARKICWRALFDRGPPMSRSDLHDLKASKIVRAKCLLQGSASNMLNGKHRS